MKKRIIALSTFIMLLLCSCAIAANSPYENEILTMFVRGAVELPSGQSISTVKDATFSNSFIKNDLIEYGATTISMAFPNFDPADSIRYSRIDSSIVVHRMEIDLVFKIFLTDPDKRNALNAKLLTYSDVLFSQKNGTIIFDTNDPEFNHQWGLYNTGQSGGTPDRDIDAPEAWNVETGENELTVGIMDSGINGSHPDLLGKITGDGPQGNYHGTHVAGIVGANTNNSLGIAGVNWHTRIESKFVGGSDFAGIYNAVWDLLDLPEIEVTNSSFHLDPNEDNVLVHSAYAGAYHIGCAMVATRGNNYSQYGSDPNYPGSFGPWMITVGAFNDLGNRSSYSRTAGNLDFLAPGGDSPVNPRGIYSTYGTNYYAYEMGTSMAAPHVTGVASLIHDFSGLLLSDDFEALLKSSCTDIYPSGWDSNTGDGLVNASAALAKVAPPNQIFRYVRTNSAAYEYYHSDQYTMRCYG
jgi:subtilisin family serine protease